MHDLVIVQPEAHAVPATLTIPACIKSAGPKASERFLTFFTDNIRNPHTREAYGRNAAQFFSWCEARGLGLENTRSYRVSVFLEELLTAYSKPTVKQHLATLRMLFDWLIVGQVLEVNPAQAVRGPKHKVIKGLTPVFSEEEAKQLFESIPLKTVTDYRDRALLGVCLYSFARIEAALGMDVRDYFPMGKRWFSTSRRRAVNCIACPPTTRWRSTSTSTSSRPDSRTNPENPCSAPRSARALG